MHKRIYSKLSEDVTIGTNPGATISSDIATFSPKLGTSMYTRMVKNFAKKSGKSVDHVRDLWNGHLEKTKKKYKENHEKYYPTAVNALKKSLGLEENTDLFADKISKFLSEND
jgi:hypothetical protein